MPDTPPFRILDASLNRAQEGLRVVEDYVRFALDDPFLTRQVKWLRHELSSLASAIFTDLRHAARDTTADVGTTISTPAEGQRSDAWDVCAASLKRTQQALRSLEEYGKTIDPEIGRAAEKLRYETYTLEKALYVGRDGLKRLEEVRLCVLVNGRESLSDFRQLSEVLVREKVGMVQLRDKLLDDRELIERAKELRRLTRGSNTLCVINDRADIAAAVHADAVHLGQEDLKLKDARAVVGTRMLIGISAHNIEQARSAVLEGANYIGAGPTFQSQTKSFAEFAGLDYLRQVAAEIRLPTFAIGGISEANLPQVLETGIARVAVSSAVTSAADPASAARQLLDMLNGCTTRSQISPVPGL